MARKRAVEAAAADVSFDTESFDRQDQAAQIVDDLATATKMPEDGTVQNGQHVQRQVARGTVLNPSSRRRDAESYKRPSNRNVEVMPGMQVVLNDFGRHGVGIQVDLPEGRKPTPEELEIIRKHISGENGFRWDKPEHLKNDRDVPKQWYKPIRKPNERPDDVPGSRAVAIRLNSEMIVENVAAELKQLHLDPVGHSERIRQEREQSADRGRIPD